MDIGPTDLPIQPIAPGEAVRRVEGRADDRARHGRGDAGEEKEGSGDPETPQDSVDVSETYRLSHPEHPPTDSWPTPDSERAVEESLQHVDIEA